MRRRAWKFHQRTGFHTELGGAQPSVVYACQSFPCLHRKMLPTGSSGMSFQLQQGLGLALL